MTCTEQLKFNFTKLNVKLLFTEDSLLLYICIQLKSANLIVTKYPGVVKIKSQNYET